MVGIPYTQCVGELQDSCHFGVFDECGEEMKALIVEDDFLSRTLLLEYLAPYGKCDTAANGREAVELLTKAYDENERYDLVCLDIMMPEVDGLEVLNFLRRLERERKVAKEDLTTVFMTTALDDAQNIMNAFTLGHCQAYLIKPILRERLVEHVREFLLTN
jgi:two-component system chemotaxis response regulator CheY